MSRLSKIKQANAAPSSDKAIAGIKAMFQERGRSLSDSTLVGQVCSMESLEPSVAAGVQQNVAQIEETLKDIFVNQLGVESFEDFQLEAAAIIAAASADPVKYSSEAYKAGDQLKVTDAVSIASGINGDFDYLDKVVSTEAFSEQELRAQLPLSVAYNFLASRQNEFGEAFFPTQTLTPDQAALLLKVRKYNLFEQVRHAATGAVTDFKWRNLVDAARDATILANESTLIVPIFTGSVSDGTWANNGGNYQYFMEDAYITGGIQKVIDGYTVNTRPLRPGVELDLIGISQHPGLVGVADHSDAIDAKATLAAIYVAVTDSSGPTTEVFKFVTSQLPRADFNKTPEGNYREIGLQFSTDSIFADTDTQTIGGVASTLLNSVSGGNKLRLTLEVSGRINTETGRTNVYSSNIVTGVVDDNGLPVVNATVAAYTYAVVGYDLTARRSNANRRSQGMLASPTEEEERYVIPLGAPITSTSPVGTNRDAADLQTLVNVTRIRNSNNAVTALLNYADTLRAYAVAAGSNIKAVVQGIGRHLVTPTFVEMSAAAGNALDLPATVNSLTSSERYNDISAALVNAIRDVSSRLVRDSGYLQALDIISGGQEMEYEVVVGTDQYLSRFIMVSGDTRTLGNGMDCAVVSSPDNRMHNKIVVSLRRKNVQGYDPLSFGSMAYIPELASSIQTSRNGATYKEATVQPRTLRMPVLPVLGYIEVTGLTDVMVENIPLNANVLP